MIAVGLLKNALQHCHLVTTTTHKTLRGPRGGMIMIGTDMENPWGIATKKGTVRKLSSLLDSAVFPGTQGGPLEHVIAAKAVAFGEALSDEYKSYCEQVILNAAAMARAFVDKGYKVISDGTDNHCMLIDLHSKNVTGKDAENALVKANITVNKNLVPFDDQSPFVTSGIRIGTPAVTTRGVNEELCVEMVELIDTVICGHENDQTIKAVGEKAKQMMKDLPLFAF